MARQPATSCKHTHEAGQPFSQAQRSTRTSKSHRENTKTAAHRPAKYSEVTKKISKPKKTISAAVLFKKQKSNGKKHRREKSPTSTPEPSLRDDLHESIKEARTAIDMKAHVFFTAVHRSFLDHLSVSRGQDAAFLESAFATVSTLASPLGEEQIETTFTREGKRVTEIVEMGKRIELFRNSVEIDKAKLEGYWKEWDELQGEYVELGREVFGTDLFVCDKSGEGERKGGYKVEVEDLYREFENTVVALREEVEEIAAEFLEIMEDSEKELEAIARKQQSKLLQAIISGD